MKKIIVVLIFIFTVVTLMAQTVVSEQEKPAKPVLKTLFLYTGREGSSSYYTIMYRDTKPDDVPQEVYDGLWEMQKEVIDNFAYDFAMKSGRKKSPYMYGATKEDYYKYGGGVCEDYSNFFILLAREKGLTENLYKVSGDSKYGGHAWLEYRTAENVYIIDPTWSDDTYLNSDLTKQRYRESPAYGREAFFVTYNEDKIICSSRGQYYNHSTFINRKETKLW